MSYSSRALPGAGGLAHTSHERRTQDGQGAIEDRPSAQGSSSSRELQEGAAGRGEAGGLAHSDGRDSSAEGLQRCGDHRLIQEDSEPGGAGSLQAVGSISGGSGGLGNPDPARQHQYEESNRRPRGSPLEASRRSDALRPDLGAWDAYDLIPCADGKARRIEPGVEPLVAGLPKGMVYGGDSSLPIDPQKTGEARIMRLRGYGNSVNIPITVAFIRSVMEVLNVQVEEGQRTPD